MADRDQYRNEVLRDIFGSSSDESSLNLPLRDADNTNLLDESSDESFLNIPPIETSNSDVATGPRQGMIFDSIASLLDAYQQHAKVKGFSVAVRSSRRDKNKEFKYVTISCERARNAEYQKQSKRIGCPARLNAIRGFNGKWAVSNITSNHNHELVPNLSYLMSAHRTVGIHMKRQLEANDISGLRPCKSVRIMQVQSGGPQNLGCLPRDCRNFIEKRRRLRLGVGDAEAIRKMFVTMQRKDRDFFHLMEVSDEGRLMNVMWIHPRCRAAYEEFHDVICFDTTYLVNRYKMPFATFVGVNHHGQSMLLGCALVTHEDIRSFRWLFTNWLEAMGNVHPTAIMTDQCESIGAAVREVLPNTIHRFCIWHIMSKLPLKFKNMTEPNNLAIEFKSVVYDSLSIESFVSNWNALITRHGLENNEWMSDLYAKRESWVPVYLNHHFWAGMLSTQRSEGMHSFFDGYINSNSTLKQFVEQYEVAIADKLQKELLADLESKNKVVKCISEFECELQFQSAYTNSIFRLVQNEIKRTMYCHFVPSDDSTNEVEKIRILERSIVNNFYHKEFTYTVEFRPNGQYFDCNCKKFEFRGVPCCHILKVMSMKDIRTINERYIINRWSKNVRRRHSSIMFLGGYPHMTEEFKKFQQVEKLLQDSADMCMNNVHKMEYLRRGVEDVQNKIMNWSDDMSNVENIRNIASMDQNNVTEGDGSQPIREPRIARSRGRPRSNRLRAANEGSGRRNTSANQRAPSVGTVRRRQTARRGRVAANNVRVDVDLNEPLIGTQGSQV